MSTSLELITAVLADGTIDDQELQSIRKELVRDGRLDLGDVKLLVELYCGAPERSAAFEALFFEVLERIFLADGEILPAEQFYLLKMLYSDRVITDREKQFLLTLRRKVNHTSPEFESLCDEALTAPATNWDVGGR